MVFIIGDKKYNTEKATKIISYRDSYETGELFGHPVYAVRETNLYKTKKGNWFTTAKSDYNTYTAFTKTDEEVKRILKALDAADLYGEHFGELEEG